MIEEQKICQPLFRIRLGPGAPASWRSAAHRVPGTISAGQAGEIRPGCRPQNRHHRPPTGSTIARRVELPAGRSLHEQTPVFSMCAQLQLSQRSTAQQSRGESSSPASKNAPGRGPLTSKNALRPRHRAAKPSTGPRFGPVNGAANQRQTTAAPRPTPRMTPLGNTGPDTGPGAHGAQRVGVAPKSATHHRGR